MNCGIIRKEDVNDVAVDKRINDLLFIEVGGGVRDGDNNSGSVL